MKKIKFNFKGVKSSLLGRTLIPIIVVFIILELIINILTVKTLTNSNINIMKSVAVEASYSISKEIEKNLLIVENISKDSGLRSEKISPEEKVNILKEYINDKEILRFGYVDIYGNMVSTDGLKVKLENIKRFMEEGKGVYGPFQGKDTEHQVMTFYSTIKEDGKVVGFLVMDKVSDFLSNIVKHIKFMNTGKAYIIDSKDVTIASFDDEMVKNKEVTIERAQKDPSLKQIADIENKMIKGETGIGEFTYGGIKEYTAYAPIKIVNWSIGITVAKDDILHSMYTINKVIFVILLISLVVLSIIIWKTADDLSKRCKILEKNVLDFAKGIFIKKENNSKKDDEITEIYDAIEESKENLINIVKKLKESGQEIKIESERLSSISYDMISNNETIIYATGEATEGNQKQSNDLVDVTNAFSEFNNNIVIMNKDMSDISNISNDIGKKAQISNDDMQNLIETMSNFTILFNEFKKGMSYMSTRMKSVNQITHMINDISERTNLLALNAAIEAARAGEAGKGFAIVAEEIRHLAEQSKDSSLDIAQVVSDVLAESDKIVENVDNMSIKLLEQDTDINKAMVSFKNISDLIGKILPIIEEVTEKFKEITEEEETIHEKIENVTAISEEITATSEEISASVDTFAESSNNVLNSSKKLSDLTENLNEISNKFTIE